MFSTFLFPGTSWSHAKNQRLLRLLWNDSAGMKTIFWSTVFFRNIQKQAAVIFWISFSIIKQKSWIYNFHFHSFSFRWKPSWMKCRAVTVARLPTNSHKIFKNAIFSKLDLQQKNLTRQVYWCVHIWSIGHWPLDHWPCCCWEFPSSAWTKSCDI